MIFDKKKHGAKIISAVGAFIKSAPYAYYATVPLGAQTDAELDSLIEDMSLVASDPDLLFIEAAMNEMNRYAVNYNVKFHDADEFKLIYFTGMALCKQFASKGAVNAVTLIQYVIIWMMDDCLAYAKSHVYDTSVDSEDGRVELKERINCAIKNKALEKHFGVYGVLIAYKSLHNFIMSKSAS